MQTWKVVQTVYQPVEGSTRPTYRTTRITLGTGLTWQAAKELRRGKRQTIILPEPPAATV